MFITCSIALNNDVLNPINSYTVQMKFKYVIWIVNAFETHESEVRRKKSDVKKTHQLIPGDFLYNAKTLIKCITSIMLMICMVEKISIIFCFWLWNFSLKNAYSSAVIYAFE